MSVFLAVIAFLLIWVGIDMVRLSKHRASLPDEVTDKIIFGHPVDLPPQARNYVESRFLVCNGAGSLVLGIVLVVSGCMVLAIVLWR